MLVTLPLVLLLLDFWPIQRFNHFKSLPRLLLEKLPLIGLAVASCVVTIFAQHEALQSFETVPFPCAWAMP